MRYDVIVIGGGAMGSAAAWRLAGRGASVLLLFPVLFVAGTSPATVTFVILGHVVLSLAIFRWSRAIFVGLDYLLDPAVPSPGDDDGREGRAPRRPRPPVQRGEPRVANARVRRRERVRGLVRTADGG